MGFRILEFRVSGWDTLTSLSGSWQQVGGSRSGSQPAQSQRGLGSGLGF